MSVLSIDFLFFMKKWFPVSLEKLVPAPSPRSANELQHEVDVLRVPFCFIKCASGTPARKLQTWVHIYILLFGIFLNYH